MPDVPFQSGVFAYPWDLEAEGYDQVAGELVANGITHVNLATAYHAGKFLLPHNPRNRTWFPEDGAVYFAPQRSRYGGVHPRVSGFVTNDGDPVARLIAAGERHGVGVVAWVVLMHNSWQGMQHPDMATHTAFGDPVIHNLSPAHPVVREYVTAVVGDLVSRYPLDGILLEAPGYLGYTHGYHHEFHGAGLDPVGEELMSLSFNPYEMERAREQGIDIDRVQRDVAGLLDRAWNDGFPLQEASGPVPDAARLLGDLDLLAYRAWQQEQVVSLARALQSIVKQANPGIEIRHMASLDGGEASPDLLATADRVLLGYADSDEDARRRAADTATDRPVHGMIRALPPDTTAPGQIASRYSTWKLAGVDGIDTYNYGFMPRWALRELYGIAGA